MLKAHLRVCLISLWIVNILISYRWGQSIPCCSSASAVEYLSPVCSVCCSLDETAKLKIAHHGKRQSLLDNVIDCIQKLCESWYAKVEQKHQLIKLHPLRMSWKQKKIWLLWRPKESVHFIWNCRRVKCHVISCLLQTASGIYFFCLEYFTRV